jgi:serine/threonine-protein kinase RsbT
MAEVKKQQVMPVRAEEDVVRVRHLVREWATTLRFSLVDQTKLVTAASELGRNMVVHGGGGELTAEVLEQGIRQGLRLVFADEGKGIQDINLAMQDGYTTGNGLGLGLGGAKRLVNDFEIQSKPGAGTRVAITRWK